MTLCFGVGHLAWTATDDRRDGVEVVQTSTMFGQKTCERPPSRQTTPPCAEHFGRLARVSWASVMAQTC